MNKTREFIGKVSGTLGGLVSIVTILAMVGSPVVAALFGMGWFTDWMNDGPDAHKFEQASLLLKITFLIYGLLLLWHFLALCLTRLENSA